MTRFLISAMVGLFLCGLACAEAPQQPFRIKLQGASDVDRLEAEGVRVDAWDGSNATIYATSAQRDGLLSEGYDVSPLPVLKSVPGYPTAEELEQELAALAAAYPAISRIETVGESKQGRPLTALLITDNPATEENEPECVYIGALHGDEPPGVMLCMSLARRLLEGYGGDARITSLVNDAAIWLIPTANPDGYEAVTRGNANGADLNRSFPVYPLDYDETFHDGALLDALGRQPEASALMHWMANNSPTICANFHAGAVVVNYPYDDDGQESGVYVASPDDALYTEVATIYAQANPLMRASLEFPGGVTNGGEWYVVLGGIQDWLYRYLGCMALTIEVSTDKTPSLAGMNAVWSQNEESMLLLLEASRMRIHGVVTDAVTGNPVRAEILLGTGQPVFTDPEVGDYHRLALPGTHAIVFNAQGYFSQSREGVVVRDGESTRLDIALAPDIDPPDPDDDPDDDPDVVNPLADCPAEVALSGEKALLTPLRTLRDKMIASGGASEKAITFYYKAAPGIAAWLRSDDRARQTFRAVAAGASLVTRMGLTQREAR